MQTGYFITFEGIDGSGKSTQLKRLAASLAAQGMQPVVTRQPGGTPVGDRIRALLLDSRTERLAAMTELGLMFADRAQSIAEIIGPALSEGRIVLCDRFTDSTEAYQGGGRELGSEVVLQLDATMCGGLKPDLTLLLMPDFDRALARARRRNERNAPKGGNEDRFEREGNAFYRRVFDKYSEIARREPLRVVVVDGDRSIEQIHQGIVQVVEERLRNHGYHMPDRA